MEDPEGGSLDPIPLWNRTFSQGSHVSETPFLLYGKTHWPYNVKFFNRTSVVEWTLEEHSYLSGVREIHNNGGKMSTPSVPFSVLTEREECRMDTTDGYYGIPEESFLMIIEAIPFPVLNT